MIRKVKQKKTPDKIVVNTFFQVLINTEEGYLTGFFRIIEPWANYQMMSWHLND